MSGKGAKGLTTGKTPSSLKDKDKKKPTSRSSRAGLQVHLLHPSLSLHDFLFITYQNVLSFHFFHSHVMDPYPRHIYIMIHTQSLDFYVFRL